MAIVIYKFAHGHSATHMGDRFNVGASTIGKHVDIVCDAWIDRNKMFDRYISIPEGTICRRS